MPRCHDQLLVFLAIATTISKAGSYFDKVLTQYFSLFNDQGPALLVGLSDGQLELSEVLIQVQLQLLHRLDVISLNYLSKTKTYEAFNLMTFVLYQQRELVTPVNSGCASIFYLQVLLFPVEVLHTTLN